MLAPFVTGHRSATGKWRWRGPGALFGLGLLALSYWGTVAMFALKRQPPPPAQRCETVDPRPAPRVHRFHDSFRARRPYRHDYEWRLEPVWSPYPTPRKLGLAYGTPPMQLIRYSRPEADIYQPRAIRF